MSYFFKFKKGDLVLFGEREGIVSLVDDNEMFGIEVQFIEPDGEVKVGYFDSVGRLDSKLEENAEIRLKQI